MSNDGSDFFKKKKYLLQILKSSSVVGFDMRRKEEREIK